MNKILAFLLCLSLLGCTELKSVTSTETKQPIPYPEQGEAFAPFVKNINTIKNDFEKEMSDKNCNKDLWLKYKWGNIFQTEANEAKITPFDIIYGDPYTTRNIEAGLLIALKNGFIDYASTWFTPTEFEMFSATEIGSKQRKDIFNRIVKKDYNCYNKLK